MRVPALALAVLASSGCVGEDARAPIADGSTMAHPEADAGLVAIGGMSAQAGPPPTVLSAEPAPTSCPADMVLVEGRYCPNVLHTCLRWMDPPGPYAEFRCARYGQPTCLSPERVALRFCIDRYEYTAPGEALPQVHHSWTSATAVCESLGKRLCLESEWQLACEGEEMRPYPYGFVRDANACNIDRYALGKPNSGLRDLREPAGARPQCVSPYGVHDLSGNVEEWATLDHPLDPNEVSTMKGAWWLPGRNTCRAATTKHGQTYEGPQVGVRCCRGANE